VLRKRLEPENQVVTEHWLGKGSTRKNNRPGGVLSNVAFLVITLGHGSCAPWRSFWRSSIHNPILDLAVGTACQNPLPRHAPIIVIVAAAAKRYFKKWAKTKITVVFQARYFSCLK
jgi:hypothetical protein